MTTVSNIRPGPTAGRVEQCPNGHILCAEAGDGYCLAKLRAHASKQGTAPEDLKCPKCRCPLPPDLPRNLAVGPARNFFDTQLEF